MFLMPQPLIYGQYAFCVGLHTGNCSSINMPQQRQSLAAQNPGNLRYRALLR
ncbi:hypothetical protein [Polaromonas sp. CG9_12]|nr:hypothetical protein [Polaromonas sp. CG9_12]